MFKIAAPETALRFESSEIDALGFRHEVFQQTHLGVPVFSGVLCVHYRVNGVFHAATGRYYPIPTDFPTTPLLSAQQATQAALASITGDFENTAESELMIVDPGWYGDISIGPHLAYRLTLTSREGPAVLGAFVDANTGQIIDQWSMLCAANERRIYDGTGQSSLPGFLARDEGDSSTGDEDVDQAYDYVGDAIAFFQSAFGRNGIDGAGSEVVVTVNSNDTGAILCPNASYDFVRNQLIFCTGATADDVVAHEWTHGLTSSTANLIYQNQSGQLNESFSDVFGELVDLYNGGAEMPGQLNGTPWATHESGSGNDAPNALRTAGCSFFPGLSDGVRWVIGEDAASMNGPFRDMWNPGCFQHPSSANDPLQSCSLIDNGGVHSGSGIPNHAFAMLCDGATFNNITVNPIGPAKAAAVWYRALTAYLTVGSDFQDAFLAFNLAASDLVGSMPNDPRTGLPLGNTMTAADASEVEKALLAVEMDTPGACGETDAPLDAAEPAFCDQADVVFFDDFESGAGGWMVSNSAPPTPYDWQLVGNLPFSRPGTAWFVEDRNVGDCSQISEAAVHDLTSPAIQTPVDFDTLTLDFVHFLELEPRFDGGLVEVQINGGQWLDIPQSLYRHNGNNISLFQSSQGNLNPLAGRLAFSGVGGTWGRSVVELASVVAPGDEIRLKFSFGKDDCFGLTGWWVDNVRMTACRSSGDCNLNGTPDEIDRASGPGAELLLDQPINLLALSNFSDLDPHPTLGPHKVVEDITLLRSTRISKVRVRGGYDDDVETPDDFTIEVFEDDNGLPGALIAAYPSVASTRLATGDIFNTNIEYAYELTLPAPLALPPGDYMIGVYNNTTSSVGTWRWGRAWFGWTPGAAFFGQGCNWCRFNTANFAIEVGGDIVGRAPADINADSLRDLQDLNAFVSVLLIGAQDADQFCAADMNSDGAVDGLDVEPFASCLLSLQCGD
ncbi:MAG: M4 family metallopeptidase [Phycisphaerales bacterium]|nr:M4 family metallopeptidase [Phycisphaerales bacterium]MCB9854292.1 M4 family metallopeptidase [Phycisphaerales bacterium]MCB9863493.1 M4 family metallopeptidase [Phycisphaerales bacterium]